MLRKVRLLMIILGFFALILVGCSSNSDDDVFMGGGGSGEGEGIIVEDILASQGLTLVDKVTYDGDTGYLAEYQDLANGHKMPKYCLVLTGKPFSMGYQAGFLLPKRTHAMLTDFMRRIALSELLGMLGIDIDPDSDLAEDIFEAFYDETVKNYNSRVQAYIPDYLKDEMHGLVQGVRDKGYDDVDFDQVLLLNQGVDSTYFFLASLFNKVPDDPNDDWDAHEMALNLFSDILEKARKQGIANNGSKLSGLNLTDSSLMRFGCNEFVVSGSATNGGQTYHGRDFMFGTANVYQDAACVMVYLPDSGYPFVTVAPPGFVGQAVGINIDGLSIGMDVCQGAAFGKDPGVGCMLVARHVLQQCPDLSSAIDTVKAMPRGVPWIYVIGDDETDPNYGCGVVLEVGRSDDMDPELGADFNGLNVLPWWQQLSLYASIDARDGVLFNDNFDDILPEYPDDGIMIRSAKWQFPEEFEGMGMTFDDPPDFSGLDLGVYFPPQREDKDDVVIATNHFILPRMRFTQQDPIVRLLYGAGPLAESIWRYDTMVDYITDNLYGNIDFFGYDTEMPAEGSAAWIIDFLNTNGENEWFYGEPTNQEVHGHHVIMNNTTKELKGLFGYMTDPWVGIDLQKFVEAWGSK